MTYALLAMEECIGALRGFLQMLGSLPGKHYQTFEGAGQMPMLLQVVVDQLERSHEGIAAELRKGREAA